jgi:hypothetical protein
MISRYMPAGKKPVPVISSEWGYASATKGVSVETQAAYAVRMQLANLMNGVPLSIWYDWKNDGTQPGNFEHNCGTVTYDLIPKPAYTALKTMNDQLKGFRLIKRLDSESKSDFILMFQNESGGRKFVVWTTEIPHTIELENMLPGGFKTKPVGWDGNTSDQYSEGNQYAINASGLPQYITMPTDSNF